MQMEHWFLAKVLVWSSLGQLLAVALGLAVALFLGGIVSKRLLEFSSNQKWTERGIRLFNKIAIPLIFPTIALLILWAMTGLAEGWEMPRAILSTGVNLIAVWIVIRLTSSVIQNEKLARLIAIAAFVVAILNVFELLQPAIQVLDDTGINFGGAYLSVSSILLGAIQLAVLLWLAAIGSRIVGQRIQQVQSLTPSIRVLTGKIVAIILYAIAILIVLGNVGIDLTAFALFTGALGVGIGFGLQRPIANLISGVILLLDRSIKPGDVIEVGDPNRESAQLFGWVTALNARYASLTTRDGTEWLVPNEDLITQRVINWSYEHSHVRLLTPFGVSFDSDVRKAMELAVEAANEVPRVLQDPAPVCRLMGFGDSSAELELRIWISDPTNGIINVRSDVLLKMWEKFCEHGIRTPLAHRDIFIKSGSEINIREYPSSPDAVA
ncbi:MAG: mechanosensitive ion channel domain-containing protein [Pseudomonadota bacterium]